MPPTINQSEHSYGVRHGVNVRSFSQSERGYGVRHGAYVRCFNQSERGYGVRHGVYVTGDTYAVLTNQSTGIAYVTACTYAFRPIRARYSNEGAPPQYVCAPLAPLAPPSPPPLAPPLKKGLIGTYITTNRVI